MSNDMVGMVVASIGEQTVKANELASQISAATTDRTKVVHDYLNSDEPADETIAKFQAWREETLAAIEAQEAKAREYVAATYLKDIDESAVDGLKAQYKEIVDAVKAARKFVTTLPGVTEDALKDVPELKTLRGGTAKGSGGKRPRLNSVSYRTSTKDNWTEVSAQRDNAKGETVTVTNFTILAGALKEKFGTKVEVKDLQAAAFEAAGTDDLSTLNGNVFEFAVSVGEQNVFVKVQPKSDDAE